MKAKGVLKGIIIAIFCSIFIPYLFNSVGNTFAGGRISYWGESWLYSIFYSYDCIHGYNRILSVYSKEYPK